MICYRFKSVILLEPKVTKCVFIIILAKVLPIQFVNIYTENQTNLREKGERKKNIIALKCLMDDGKGVSKHHMCVIRDM
jgi:hypothetical protein